MNELTKFLVEGILNEETEKAVALFGGGFKPPTKGHLEVVNQGIKQNPEISEVKILVGGGERNGFTQDQSVKIWNLYNDVGFINKPATIIPVSSPFTYYKNYLKDNPDDKVYVFIGSRPDDEKDQMDVKQRSEFVKKYSDNVIPVEVSTTGGVSGTLARKLFKTDLDGFRNMFPENLLDIDFKKILDILNNKSTDNTRKSTPKATEPLTPLNEDPKKGTGKKPKGSGRRLYTDEDPKDTVGIKFSTRQDIVDTLNKKSFKAKSHARQSQIINLIHQRVRAAYGRAKDPAVKKRLKTGLDYITDKKEASKKKTQRLKKKKLNENATYSSKIDYKQQIKDLTKHMIKKGMNILPLPKVIFKHGDQENASQFLGKTAYYSPSDMTVVLYTEGRHPKDIVRSFAHEMIHHIQNLEDRLENINTTNTTEDDNLNDIEREAYTKGNMTFRNWTDSLDGEEVTSLNEVSAMSTDLQTQKITINFEIDGKKISETITLAMSPDSRGLFEVGENVGKYNGLSAEEAESYNETPDDVYVYGMVNTMNDGKDIYFWTNGARLAGAAKNVGAMPAILEQLSHEGLHLGRSLIAKHINGNGYPTADWPSIGEQDNDEIDEETLATVVGVAVEQITKPFLKMASQYIPMLSELPELNEAIVGEKIECDNCGWNWNIVDGGNDLYMCHKCGHDNEPENGDPFGLKAYARELVKEVFSKTVIINMDVVNTALKNGIFIDSQETDENAIAIIDAAPQGKVPHPVFLDFYAKFDKYFGEENDKRILDEFGLEQILTNILNLPNEDVQIVMNHYNTTDQDNVEWFEQHDNELEKEEEFNIPGFDSSQDDHETVVNYRKQQLAKSLEEQERVRIFNPNCGCDKT